jgi:FixJ family two-component response regulator
VIFCDLMMPQVTGMEFFERLNETAPEQADAVVFITGGAFTEAAIEFVERLEQPLLEKPFDVAALYAVVNDRL